MGVVINYNLKFWRPNNLLEEKSIHFKNMFISCDDCSEIWGFIEKSGLKYWELDL